MSDFDPDQRAEALWSSEAASALGLPGARFSPAQVWASKRRLADLPGDSENIAARLGLACQDGVARLHIEDTGHELLPLSHVTLRRDVDGVRMGSHYDYANKTIKALHEVKFFGMARRKEFGEAGSDVVPYDVLVQALHEMIVWNADSTGYFEVDSCEVDVVFGNVERAVFVIPYDVGAVEKLIRMEASFQALVDANTPPAPTSPEDARTIWRKADGSERVASGQTLQACTALSSLKKQIKQMEAQAEEMELFVQRAMETASVLKSPEVYVLATWKSTSTDRVDIKRLRDEMPKLAEQFLKTTESRRFLLKG